MLGIAVFSFILPGVSPLLLFQLGLLGVGKIDFLQRLGKLLINSFCIIGLLGSSMIFGLAITIDPRK